MMWYRRLLCGVVFVFLQFMGLAQEENADGSDTNLDLIRLSGTELKSFPSSKLSKVFDHYKIISIPNLSSIKKKLKDPYKTYQVQIEFSEIIQDEFHIYQTSIIPENQIIKTSSGNQKKQNHPLTLKGVGRSIGKQLSLTINEDFIYGYFKIGDDLLFIEPLSYFEESAKKSSFIIYNSKDVISDGKLACGVNEMTHKKSGLRQQVVPNKVAGSCYIVELAIASDKLMYSKYGNSITAVTNHTSGVMNNVQNNYDNEFDDVIEFRIVVQYIVDSGNDPWTSSTSASTLLSEFGTWAYNQNGFGVSHDLGQLWTNRNLSGSTVGIAYIEAVCYRNYSYHVLQDFGTNADDLRVLTAHEIGHNFGANHDSQGGYIMTGYVNNTNSWSTASKNSINNFIDDLTSGNIQYQPNCLTSDCGSGGSVQGCTDSNAHNYNPAATVDDGSCETCTDGILNGDETGTDCGGSRCPSCPGGGVTGCTDSGSHNYNPAATIDDGSCETCNDGILNGDETGADCGGSRCIPCNSCNPITLHTEHIESFESGFSGWFQSQDDDIDWIVNSGGTPSSGTGPGSAVDGSYYVYLEASSPNYPSKSAVISSPCFDISQMGAPKMTTIFHMFGNTMGSFKIQLQTLGGSPQTITLLEISGALPSDDWYINDPAFDLNAVKNDPIRFVFTATSGSSWASDIAFDQLRIYDEQPGTCADGIKNGDETGVDCGGNSCALCPCTNTNLVLTGNIRIETEKRAQTFIETSEISTTKVSNGADVMLSAGQYVELNPNFEIELGSSIEVFIDNCDISSLQSRETPYSIYTKGAR